MNPWHCVLSALPRHARDDILADLLEEAAAAPAHRGVAWVTWQLLAVAWDYHRVDLLQVGTVRALALGISGFVLLHLALEPAAHSLVATAVALGPGWQGLLATVWGTPSVVAAVTAGLVIGMVRQPAGSNGEAWRWLAVVGGACGVAVAQTLTDAGPAALALAGSAVNRAADALLSLVALTMAIHHRHHQELTDG